MSFISVNVNAAQVASYVKLFPESVGQAMMLAVTEATKFGYAESSRQIRQEVNLPRSYIGSADAGNRLRIARRATKDDPRAVISASKRPVSLARFTDNRSLAKRKAVNVSVKPGRTKTFNSGFLIRLRSGRTISADQFNIGLAVRLKPGETLARSRSAVKLGNRAGRKGDDNVYLLYGPSVDQVFQEVRYKVTPAIEQKLESEFLRQFNRLNQ